jgi:hypothetical protein
LLSGEALKIKEKAKMPGLSRALQVLERRACWLSGKIAILFIFLE